MCDNSSKKHSGLLTAYFFQLCTGNDNPYRMDYQGCCHPLTILYPLRPEGIRGYFANDIGRSVHVGIDLSSVCCLVQSTLHPLATEGVFCLIVRFPYRQRIAVKETGL